MSRRALIAAVSVLAMLASPALAQRKAAPAPATASAAGDPVAARVNGVVLHRSDVIAAQKGLPEQYQKSPLDKIYQPLLQNMVNGILMAQAARKAKVQDQPAVKRRLDQMQDEILADAYASELAKQQITEPKLHQYYEQYVKNAPPREEVHARHILVPTEDEAKAIIAQLQKGADFSTLAKEKTTDPSGKTSGGDLGYFTQDEMVPAFAAAAFKLKPGEYTTTPVHTQFGWHVIKVEDRRQAKPGTYEQVAPQIAAQASQQMIGEKIQQLRSEGKIEEFALDGSKLPVVAAAAPPRPAAPAAAPAAAKQAPVLMPEAAGGPAGVPTMAPGTAPDQLGK